MLKIQKLIFGENMDFWTSVFGTCKYLCIKSTYEKWDVTGVPVWWLIGSSPDWLFSILHSSITSIGEMIWANLFWCSLDFLVEPPFCLGLLSRLFAKTVVFSFSETFMTLSSRSKWSAYVIVTFGKGSSLVSGGRPSVSLGSLVIWKDLLNNNLFLRLLFTE